MADSYDDVERPRARRGDRGVFGLVVVFLGVVWLLGRTNLLHLAADTLLAVLLMCLGAGLLLTRRSGRHKWPILLGAVVLFVLMGNSAAADGHVHFHGAGNPTYTPRNVSDLHPYDLGAGNMTIDLTGLSLSADPTVHASVDAGNLRVLLPRGAALELNYTDRLGNVTLDGVDLAGGINSHSTWKSSGYGSASAKVALDLNVYAGNIVVEHVSGTGPKGA